MIEIIPSGCIDLLPFSEEGFLHWKAKADLGTFLYRLHDKGGTIVAPDGATAAINYAEHGSYTFKRHQGEFRELIKRLRQSAGKTRQVKGVNPFVLTVPDFRRDLHFGKALKYLSAWDAIVSEILADSSEFSLSHLLEQQTDLECSVSLMEQFYYRQSIQTLRSFLETAVLQLHFCMNDGDFQNWRQNKFKVPSMRQKNEGLLWRLRDGGAITANLATRSADLYGELNGFIHGSEAHLIHRGAHVGKWRGQVFKEDDFHEWCDLLSRTVEIGIRFIALTTERWHQRLIADPEMCSICHGKAFDETPVFHAGRRLRKMKCRQCGWEQHRTSPI